MTSSKRKKGFDREARWGGGGRGSGGRSVINAPLFSFRPDGGFLVHQHKLQLANREKENERGGVFVCYSTLTRHPPCFFLSSPNDEFSRVCSRGVGTEPDTPLPERRSPKVRKRGNHVPRGPMTSLSLTRERDVGRFEVLSPRCPIPFFVYNKKGCSRLGVRWRGRSKV